MDWGSPRDSSTTIESATTSAQAVDAELRMRAATAAVGPDTIPPSDNQALAPVF